MAKEQGKEAPIIMAALVKMGPFPVQFGGQKVSVATGEPLDALGLCGRWDRQREPLPTTAAKLILSGPGAADLAEGFRTMHQAVDWP